MRLFARRPRSLPLPFPRLDGSTWPDPSSLGPSFAASTLYEMARQEAFSAAAHDVTDVLVDEVLPMLDTGAVGADGAHMQQVCSAAAQIGAGIALVERRSVRSEEERTDREVANALRLAREDLPRMPPRQEQVARYLLQCGYYLARAGPDRVAVVLAALAHEEHPAVRHRPAPGPTD